MGPSRSTPKAVHRTFVAVSVILGVNQIHAIGWPQDHKGLWAKIVYDACILLISALALLRATRGPDRGPWLLVALGLTAWTFGDVYYTVVLMDAAEVPFPSPADVGYLLMPPLVVAGVLWQSHRQGGRRPRALWVDGIAAACAVGALLAAVVIAPVLRDPGDDLLTVIFTGAAPVGDTLMLALTVGVLARTGWQLERRTMLLIAGVLSFAAADSAYLVTVLNGTYNSPDPIDTGWWLGLLLIAMAAWQPASRDYQESDDVRRRLVVMPLAFATLALGVLVVASDGEVPWLAVTLATISLLAVMVRLMLTFGQNVSMLKTSRVEALTDPLTGLGNRRELARELARRLEGAERTTFDLVLFDLDGFKHYNDSYGHPAGDALLQRLGQRLVDHVEGRGHAFRVGGDEFCALIPVTARGPEEAADMLVEAGDGFHIGASFGWIRLPEETDDAVEAIRIADQRLYANKHASRGSAGRQTADALLHALAAHEPVLVAHAHQVADLAEATAAQMGLPESEVALVRQTGELHDIGKLGVPSAILGKAGPLDDEEWAFVQRHTVIGERIIGAAPALLPVSRLVRATHERWDGTGYPDRTSGADVALPARIVAVADAFAAMTEERPYRPTRSAEEALAELRRCAGTQFDPVVVQAFDSAWLALNQARADGDVVPA